MQRVNKQQHTRRYDKLSQVYLEACKIQNLNISNEISKFVHKTIDI